MFNRKCKQNLDVMQVPMAYVLNCRQGKALANSTLNKTANYLSLNQTNSK
jgi:hypothetical protein